VVHSAPSLPTLPVQKAEHLRKVVERLDLSACARQAADAAPDGRTRAGHLVRTLERQVIPRMVQAHRATAGAEPAPTTEDLKQFVAVLMAGEEAGVQAVVQRLREQGLSVESIYLRLLAPAACALGTLWDQDICDFPAVTVGAGRLQRLLRELSPDFEAEGPEWPAHPGPARRVLLVQPPQEQHSFGLSMVATFFRREGWLVDGGVGASHPDPALRAQADWFDVVGYSCGSQARLGWMRDSIASLRLISRNPAVLVLVGGPLFVHQPESVQWVGADACAAEAGRAPQLAASLLAALGTPA
jgi:methanogenic corrinoid protein MtbC1